MKIIEIELVGKIKENIRRSRYNASKAINKELILLYYSIGNLLSDKISVKDWGSKVLEHISSEIQKEFKGIRGFSVRNLKNMRQFYDEYAYLQFGQLATAQIDSKYLMKDSYKSIRQLITAQFNINNYDNFINTFFSVSFTSHILLINRCKGNLERYFYIRNSVENQWTVDLLRYHLDSNLYKQKGKLQNNFDKIVPSKIKVNALKTFRDEYLLNFIQVNDENDELQVENAIIENVKKFMLTLGKEFTYMGNQYRVVVDGEEFFIDLLFYHRGLQSMVAIELKTGKFKPEYTGKMNFYLAALDEYVRLPHENPSIGIILCKEKSRAIVEFAFKYTDAPIGVATYMIAKKLPAELKKYLPSVNDFKKILEK